ncbi:MAG: hypothetical protein V2G42_07400 [bacterium JZ-2024 1]
MTSLSPENWVRVLLYSGILGFLILILGISIYLIREFLLQAAERDKSDIRRKVKLLEFHLRGFRHDEE